MGEQYQQKINIRPVKNISSVWTRDSWHYSTTAIDHALLQMKSNAMNDPNCKPEHLEMVDVIRQAFADLK